MLVICYQTGNQIQIDDSTWKTLPEEEKNKYKLVEKPEVKTESEPEIKPEGEIKPVKTEEKKK